MVRVLADRLANGEHSKASGNRVVDGVMMITFHLYTRHTQRNTYTMYTLDTYNNTYTDTYNNTYTYTHTHLVDVFVEDLASA